MALVSSPMLKHLTVALLLVWSSVAQEPAATVQGTWSASGSARTFRGTWSAEVQPRTPDAAKGSWTLLDEKNRLILQGTWSAQKRDRTWAGNWSAQIVTRTPKGSTAGRLITGTWTARMEPSGGATFLEMLQRTLDGSVGGTWRSGGHGGEWTLSGSRK
jgi:hypothetical protein